MKSIIYTGYTYSGGIISGLILRELESVLVPANMEFRLMKERYGICDLQEAIFENSDPEIIDLAIKDFAWLTKKYARPQGLFKKTGFGYDEKSNNAFSKETINYINSITDHQYKTTWHFYDFRESFFKTIFWRLVRKLFRSYKFGRKLAYFSYPDYENFILETKSYLNKIIQHFVGFDKNIDEYTIALPKAINPYRYQQILKVMSYFDDCKIIIVDRDPRDIYLELLRSGKERYLMNSDDPSEKAKSFIKFFLALRQDQEKVLKNSNILLLNFEDLCLDYETSLKKIYDFLDITEKEHIKKGEFFIPNDSKENISLWREVKGDEKIAIKVIEENLSGYLYVNSKNVVQGF